FWLFDLFGTEAVDDGRCVCESRRRGDQFQCVVNLFHTENAFPSQRVGGNQRSFGFRICRSGLPEELQKVLKSEKRICDTRFCPIEESTSRRRNDDISRIAVEMPERVRNSKVPELLENVIEVTLQLAECGVRQRRPRGFCLQPHEAVGKDEKGIHLTLQPVSAQISRACCENFVTSGHGRDLQIGERNDRLFPLRSIRILGKGGTVGFPHEPAIPRLVGCENLWHILWDPGCQTSRYKKFVNVRFSDCLEPDGFSVRLEADESKGRTCLKLAKMAIPAESGRLELRADPLAEFFE